MTTDTYGHILLCALYYCNLCQLLDQEIIPVKKYAIVAIIIIIIKNVLRTTMWQALCEEFMASISINNHNNPVFHINKNMSCIYLFHFKDEDNSEFHSKLMAELGV